MKLRGGAGVIHFPVSPPSRGAWIEISTPRETARRTTSPPSRGAWIEMMKYETRLEMLKSPPSRGAWIEMSAGPPGGYGMAVAPLAGGVD